MGPNTKWMTTGPRARSGFSLIELMVTLSVAAILLALAAPSFQNMIMGNRQTTAVNELVGDLSLARSEAVKRRQHIAICPRSGSGCTALDGTTWGNGWLVYVDNDASGNFNAAKDTVLRRRDAQHDGYTVNGTRAVAVFQPEGDATGTPITFNFCDPRGSGYARQVLLSNTGRTRLNKGTACP